MEDDGEVVWTEMVVYMGGGVDAGADWKGGLMLRLGLGLRNVQQRVNNDLNLVVIVVWFALV